MLAAHNRLELDRTLEDDLALAALRMILRSRTPVPGLVHHSDRGIQYASKDYTDLLKHNGAHSFPGAVVTRMGPIRSSDLVHETIHSNLATRYSFGASLEQKSDCRRRW